VDLFFSTPELASACNRRSALESQFGQAHAEGIALRLAELHALECLADAAALPQLQISRDGSDVLIEDAGLLRIRAQPGPSSAPPTRARWVKIDQLTILNIQPCENA